MKTSPRDAALRALTARAQAGAPLRLWLRDDDAVQPTSALARLLCLAADRRVDLTLAVIPAPWQQAATGPELARELADHPNVSVAIHGWSHHNHAPAAEKKQELGLHRPMEQIRGELRCGLQHLQSLHGARILPLLVPPWNRIAPELVAALAEDGFTALSTFGDEPSLPGLAVVNTHLDIIDWHGTRGARPADAVWAELAALAMSGRKFAGVLTHHLVHDQAAWELLEDLISASTSAGAQWCPVHALSHQLRQHQPQGCVAG
jgi:peptidoglycan/xylan/chitin deacetylase (PgdA/CDA1 family)